jgi:hypothetical protein
MVWTVPSSNVKCVHPLHEKFHETVKMFMLWEEIDLLFMLTNETVLTSIGELTSPHIFLNEKDLPFYDNERNYSYLFRIAYLASYFPQWESFETSYRYLIRNSCCTLYYVFLDFWKKGKKAPRRKKDFETKAVKRKLKQEFMTII